MELSRSLLRSFARTINDDSANKKVTNSMAGTVVMSNDSKFVKIDGSEALTPVHETVDIQEGDRVLVTIEGHMASVIGNYTYPPSARTANSAYAMSEQNMVQVEHLSATSITTENLTAHSAEITNLVAENINAGYAKITELDAMHASIEELEAKSITTDNIEAEVGKFGYLTAEQAEIDYAKISRLEATEGRIDTLESTSITTETLKAEIAEIGYLSAEEIEAKYATIEELNATNGKITTLEGDYLDYKEATIDELEAHDAVITNLSGDFASYKEVMAQELITAKGWMLEGSIGSAQISSVDATKITSGILDTSLITVQGSDGKLQIIDNTMQITDALGVVRVQIGKDASDDYSMSVWDQNGLLIWDALGATENTIQRKIIKDKMVADDAAIQALKIDFQSFETALTEQGVTISGTVVQVGDKTLNVELSEQKQTISDNYTSLQEYTDSAVDGIEVGGRNLIRNSNFSNGAHTWWVNESSLGTTTVIEDPLYGHYLQFTVSANSRIYNSVNNVWKAGQVYTYSFMAKASVAGVTIQPSRSVADYGKTHTLTTEWVRYTGTILSTATAEAGTLSFTCNSGDATYYITNVKLEKGTKSTDWTPAPEDAQSQIDGHTETLSDHSARITANEEAIALRVTTQEYETYKNSVDGQLDSMGSRMSATESSISVLQDEIDLKVEQADIEEAIDNIQIGGRNLIRNSNTLDFDTYYFGAYLMTSTDDGSGNVTIDYPPLNVTDDQNGNVTFEGVIATYNDSGNVTFTQQ